MLWHLKYSNDDNPHHPGTWNMPSKDVWNKAIEERQGDWLIDKGRP